MELNRELYIKGVSDYLENGLNLFDGTWESGSINNSGANVSSDTSIRSNYVSIASNTSYYFSSTTSSAVAELWANYYNNGTFVSREYLGVTNSKNFTTPAGVNQVRFRLSFSDTVTANVVSNVMLNKGSIQLPYEPYNGGYASKDYLENGKNLWNYNATNTIVGVTSTYNNSTLTLNGTATGEASNISHTNMTYLKSGTYTFKIVKESGSATGSQAIIFKNYTTNTTILNTTLNLSTGNTYTFTLQNSAWVSLAIYFFNSNVFTNLKLDIQIEKGSSATPYEKYYGKYLNKGDGILIPYTLYENESGTNGNITLSDYVKNYKFVEIYYRSENFIKTSLKFEVGQDVNNITLYTLQNSNNGASVYLNTRTLTVSGTSVATLATNRYSVLTIGSSGISSYNNNNNIYITKVIGYK